MRRKKKHECSDLRVGECWLPSTPLRLIFLYMKLSGTVVGLLQFTRRELFFVLRIELHASHLVSRYGCMDVASVLRNRRERTRFTVVGTYRQ